MLRFLSRRKGRGAGASSSDTNNASSQIKAQRIVANKNLVQCRVILLDGTDLPVDLSVSTSSPCDRDRFDQPDCQNTNMRNNYDPLIDIWLNANDASIINE